MIFGDCFQFDLIAAMVVAYESEAFSNQVVLCYVSLLNIDREFFSLLMNSFEYVEMHACIYDAFQFGIFV